MTSEERISDIKEGIESYTVMAAMISQGNDVIVSMMAGWLRTLVSSLVEWGALTTEEHDVLMRRLEVETEELQALHNDLNGNSDNSLEAWLQQRGI